MIRAELAFATPRKLPKARDLKGRVVVLDVAFAAEQSGSGGFDKLTRPFILALGPRLIGWIDHHDHILHAEFANDPRFVLAKKQEHGACPEMVTPEVVKRLGPADTIVCHVDFDGLCSAAKWMREGEEPYAGADDDARAIDTRIGVPSVTAQRIDRAIRGRPRDSALLGIIVRHLSSGLRDASLWGPIDAAGAELAGIETHTRKVAGAYKRYAIEKPTTPARTVAFLDATADHGKYDKTMLLLLGQERADMAMIRDLDTLSLAAPFNSGINFSELLGLSGGMPTLVSIQKERLKEALERLGLGAAEIAHIAS